jgi:hypothetical protein
LGLYYALRQGYALLGARDIEALRQLHATLAKATANSDLVSKRIYGVARLGALIPDATDGFEDNIKLVRDARQRATANGSGIPDVLDDNHFLALTYGAMLYRLKRYEEAADALNRVSARLSDATDRESQYIRVSAEYFLAMARRQLGHEVQAGRLLDQASAADEVLQNDPSLTWHWRVALDAVRREADGLIEP